jgi:hypothetical protein
VSGHHDRRELSPIAIQVLGALLLVAFVAIWYFTGRESDLMVGGAISLLFSGHLFRISIGQENREKEALREALEAYDQAKRAAENRGGDGSRT